MSLLSLARSVKLSAHSFAIMPVKRNSFLRFCLIIINIVVFFPILVLHFISSARCKCTWFHCSLNITKLLRIFSLSLSASVLFDYKRTLFQAFLLFFTLLFNRILFNYLHFFTIILLVALFWGSLNFYVAGFSVSLSVFSNSFVHFIFFLSRVTCTQCILAIRLCVFICSVFIFFRVLTVCTLQTVAGCSMYRLLASAFAIQMWTKRNVFFLS